MKRKIFLVVIIMLSVFSHVQAQRNYDDRLRLDIAPYVWATTMNGNLTISGENRYVNFTFDDFFKFSNLGLNGHIELKKKKWAILFDYNYVELLKDPTITELVLSELAFGYKIFGDFELLLGGRYFKTEVEYRHDDPEQIKKGKESWIDPIIGGRLTVDLTRTLVFTARADVGGFGIGSEFAWNIMAGVGYRLSNITFMVAYRIWYAKYENGANDDLFVYDLTTSGPGLAMVIHF